MFGDGSLTFREFVMRESLPLATIHDAVLEFLRGRDDRGEDVVRHRRVKGAM